MIFVTVGAQMPFDRLIRAVDAWAARHRHIAFYAQIGPSAWKPRHVPWTDFLDPKVYRQQIEAATAIVAHAGIGSILAALELGKPILIMPRRCELGETRNDHQVATADRFEQVGGVRTIIDEPELDAKLTEIIELERPQAITHQASSELLARLRAFVMEGASE